MKDEANGRRRHDNTESIKLDADESNHPNFNPLMP